MVFSDNIFAEDTVYIKIHFLYGPRPKREFKESELKWFSGKFGGHVGLEVGSNKVIDFVPFGKFHWFARKNNRHSKFAIRTTEGFWEIFGGTSETVKKATVIIPITKQQKQKLDNITNAYTTHTPYDYAFIGMRCGSATYDILAQLGILRQYSFRKTYLKIFYPKKLRKRIFKIAYEQNWTIIKQEGVI